MFKEGPLQHLCGPAPHGHIAATTKTVPHCLTCSRVVAGSQVMENKEKPAQGLLWSSFASRIERSEAEKKNSGLF